MRRLPFVVHRIRMSAQQMVEADGESPDPRIRLALSILQQRHFCDTCSIDTAEAVLALLGATLDELRQQHSP